jgi:hypothetical protein
MREHFGLDALVQYGTEPIPAAVTVLNPAWRELNRQVRQRQAECKSLQKQQQNVGLLQPLSEAVVRHYEQRQGDLHTRMEELHLALDRLKQRRKQTPRQIPVQDLPEADRFTRLRTERKYFLDTIKMIAYRAETSMAFTVREKLKRTDDARALLRQIYSTEADLIPDLEAKTLTVRLHQSDAGGARCRGPLPVRGTHGHGNDLSGYGSPAGVQTWVKLNSTRSGVRRLDTADTSGGRSLTGASPAPLTTAGDDAELVDSTEWSVESVRATSEDGR